MQLLHGLSHALFIQCICCHITSYLQVWVDWVNAVLRQHDLQLKVQDVRVDLADGAVLAALVECLGTSGMCNFYCVNYSPGLLVL